MSRNSRADPFLSCLPALSFPRERPASAPPREVSLLRHSLPALSSPSIPALTWTSSISPLSPHPIPLEYDIRIPNRPLGWNDSSQISFRFRAPQGAAFHLKSLELILSREVTFLHGSTSATIVDDVPLDFFRIEDSPKVVYSPFATPTSTPTEEVERLVWRSPSPPDRGVASPSKSSWPLSLVEGVAGFNEMHGQLKFRPRPSSNHRWSLGETGENKFVRISYTIRPRVSVSHFLLHHFNVSVLTTTLLRRSPTSEAAVPSRRSDISTSNVFPSVSQPSMFLNGRTPSELSTFLPLRIAEWALDAIRISIFDLISLPPLLLLPLYPHPLPSMTDE